MAVKVGKLLKRATNRKIDLSQGLKILKFSHSDKIRNDDAVGKTEKQSTDLRHLKSYTIFFLSILN
jgi:hypothetical protein